MMKLCHNPGTRAFTLIEIMIVCALLAIVLTFSIPRFSSARQAEPLNRALKELTEACSHARARAILGGKPTQLVFRPDAGTFSVAGGGGGTPVGSKGSGLSGSFDQSLMVEMLDINLREFRQAPVAVVTFYPNGICDELTVVLRSQDNEYRKFSLEGTTGLSKVSRVDEL
jgi:prepilin-type N-terminal cleavage/methylation domain-containing protein